MRLGPYYVVMKLIDLELRKSDAIAVFEDNIKLIVDRKDYWQLKDKVGEFIGVGYHLELIGGKE